MYANHGGIGLRLDDKGELVGLKGNEMRSLNVRDSLGNWIAHQMTFDGWTTEKIAKALEEASGIIEKYNPVTAFLGDECIGSTEL